MNTKQTDAAEIALVPPEDVNVFRDLRTEAQTQKAKTEEDLKKREREWGKQTSDCMRQNHEGGVMESFGAAAGKLAFDALSKKTEDARKALDSAWPCATQPAKNN
jgi:hypothetical protein